MSDLQQPLMRPAAPANTATPTQPWAQQPTPAPNIAPAEPVVADYANAPASGRRTEIGLMSDRLGALVRNSPNPLGEQARQEAAFVMAEVYGVDPGLAYQNPWPYVAAWTGYDPRGPELSGVDSLNEHLHMMAEAWRGTTLAADINAVRFRAMLSPDPEVKQGYLDQAAQMATQLPGYDIWAGGLPREALRIVSSTLASLADMSLSWIEAFSAEGMARQAGVGVYPEGSVQDRVMGGVEMPYSETRGDRVMVPLIALASWGISAVPGIGRAMETMAGAAYGDLRDAGVDDRLARYIAAPVGAAASAIEMLQLSSSGRALANALGETEAARVLREAVFNGTKRYLMGGGYMGAVVRTGAARLETTAAGRGGMQLVRLVANQSVEVLDNAAQEAMQEVTTGLGQMVGIELSNALNGTNIEGVELSQILENAQKAFTDTVVGMGLLSAVGTPLGRLAGAALGQDTNQEQANPQELQVVANEIRDGITAEMRIAAEAITEEQANEARIDAAGRTGFVMAMRPDATGGTQAMEATAEMRGQRQAPGVMVDLARPSFDPATVVSGGEAVSQIAQRVPAPVATAFQDRIRNGATAEVSPAITAWESQGNDWGSLAALADSIREQDFTPQAFGTAQKYGISLNAPVVAEVRVNTENLATLNAEEMKNPWRSAQAYQKQGFDGVIAGDKLYVFNQAKIQKVGQTDAATIPSVDPDSVSVETDGQDVVLRNGTAEDRLKVDVSREGQAAVSGDVSASLGRRAAKKVATLAMGRQVQSESRALMNGIASLNPDAQTLAPQLRGAELELETAREAKASDGTISALESQVAELKRKLYTPTTDWFTKQAHTMTKAEYEADVAARVAARAKKYPAATVRDGILRVALGVSEEQADSIAQLVSSLERRTADKLISRIEALTDDDADFARGRASIFKSGERVIALRADADVDTVFEEVMHLARQLLTQEELSVLVEELGLEVDENGALTRDGEERFVDAARSYLMENEKPPVGTETFWSKLRQWVADIVKAIRVNLSPKANEVFDRLFRGETYPSGVDALGFVAAELAAKEADEELILYSESGETAHEKVIREAVEAGKFVPDLVLQDYLHRDWAMAEFTRRHPEESQAVEDLAAKSATFEEFWNQIWEFGWLVPVPAAWETENSNAARDEQLARDFFEASRRKVNPRAQANTEWQAEMETDAGLRRWVDAVAADKSVLKQFPNLPGKVYSAIATTGAGKGISETTAKALRNAARNYPSIMREAAARASGDPAVLQAFENEESAQAVQDAQNRTLGIEDAGTTIQRLREEIASTTADTRRMKESLRDTEARMAWQDRAAAAIQADLSRARRVLADDVAAVANEFLVGKKSKPTQIGFAEDVDLAVDARKSELDADGRKPSTAEKKAMQAASNLGLATRGQINALQRAVLAGSREAIAQVTAVYEDALKSARDEARIGTRDALEQERAEEKVRRAEARAKAGQALRDALTATERQLKDAEKKRRNEQRIRQLKIKLARQIMAPISSKSVSVQVWGALRAIQDALDPTFRTSKKWKYVRELFRRFPEQIAPGNPEMQRRFDKMADLAQKRSLEEMSLEELAETATEFRHWYARGQELLTQRNDDRTMRLMSRLDTLKKALPPPNRLVAADGKPVNAETAKAQDKITDWWKAWTLDPQRFFDLLDGGKDYKGAWMDTFYRLVDEAVNEELRMEQEFRAEFETVLQANGFAKGKRASVSSLYQTVEYNGQQWQVQEIMDVYLKWKNEKSRAAIIGDGIKSGNRIDQATRDGLVALLTPEQKAVADWILDWYNRDANKERLAAFHEEFANTEFVVEENYTRMRRMGRFVEYTAEQIKSDLMGRSSAIIAKVDDSITRTRQQIKAENQRALRLGIIDEVVETVHIQSHYLSHAEAAHLLTQIVSNDELMNQVQVRAGNKGVDFLKNYVERIKNPDINKNPQEIFRVMRRMASNISRAYMSFNPKTIARQIPAFLYYAGEFNNPLYLMKGIAAVQGGWTEAFREIERLSPQFANRVMDPMMREVITGTDDNFVAALADKGMAGISVVDKVVAAWGWYGLFLEAKESGASETRAARHADEAMNRTQQVSSQKDQSQLYGGNEFFKWWTMFTGPLNKVWNIMTYDQWHRPNKMRTAMTAIGVMTAGLLGWIVANGRVPDEPDEWAEVVSGEILGAPIPLIGSSVVNMAYGFDRTGRLSPWEFVEEGLDAAKIVAQQTSSLLDGNPNTRPREWGDFMLRLADKTYGAVALGTGIPLVQTRRVFKIAGDAVAGRPVWWGDLMGKDWGKEE